MIYDGKIIRLKDGREALMRSAEADDAAQMLEYLRTTAGETEFVIRYPEECSESVDQEAAYLQSIIDSPLNMMIACEINGKIVGNCQLMLHGRLKTKHRAGVAIALIKDYWGLGIGTAMFEEMIRIAKVHGIRQIELKVIEGNERAMRLYRKMGFGIVAEKPDAIQLKDGTLLKEFLMIKKL